ncbi:MAG: glycine betaine/L-proline ABC transporter ATP-binding protein ProV [Sneathiellaceae bacterium]
MESQENNKITVSNLFKVFGSEPEKALELYKKGLSKEQILAETGQTIGVIDANFSVREGEIFVVMGLSGSGKSTLVRLLNRLIEPTAGTVVVDGLDVTAADTETLIDCRRRKMSMVFQSFALFPHMTVLQNTLFGLDLAGVPMAKQLDKGREVLDQVGLSPWAESYPDELSGGMKQRVGLARALANDPAILLMDEAFSALDPLIRAEMQDELMKLQSAFQKTIVFISHDLDEATKIGDRIAVMEGGLIAQIGTPDEILNSPANDYVRSFFRGVDISQVLTAGDIARKTQVTVLDRQHTGLRAALSRLQEYERQHGYVVDRGQRFHGIVSVESLNREIKAKDPDMHRAMLPGVEPIAAGTTIADIVGRIAESPYGLPVVDDNHRYLGVISKTTLLQAFDRDSETPSDEPSPQPPPAQAAPGEQAAPSEQAAP